MWTRLVVMKSVVEAPTFCYRCDRAIVFRIETHAKKRDAKVYAELLGYGVSSDAEHISEPDPTGQHPARAMKMAFADAGINPEEIDYINAHGTTTPLGGASETRAGAQCTTADLPAAGRRGSFGHHGLAPMSLSSEHTAPRCRSSDRRQYERR
jgi:hypothetical protein